MIPQFQFPFTSGRSDEPVNVAVLAKSGERFVVIYHDAQKDEALRALSRYAAEPELEFNWYDAAAVARRIREGAVDETQ